MAVELNEKTTARFEEVTASYTINRICGYVNRKKYKEHIAVITNYLKSIDESYIDNFKTLFTNSYNEQIVGASKKEIYGAIKHKYKKPNRIANKLGLSYYKYNNVYKDLIVRDFMTQEWLDTLEPISDEKTLEMCKIMNSFVDNFKYLAGEPYYEHYNNFRCMELEFYIIYSKLIDTLGSPVVTEKFLYNLCLDLDIEWGTISYLLRNMHLIMRNDNIQMRGNKQLKKEIFNLMYLKGFNKGDVGEFIFDKPRKHFYSSGYDYLTKDITEDEWEFSMTLSPTVDWSPIKKEEVLNFIDVFRGFCNENL